MAAVDMENIPFSHRVSFINSNQFTVDIMFIPLSWGFSFILKGQVSDPMEFIRLQHGALLKGYTPEV